MTEKAVNFIGFLWKLDRKAFAHLRRSLRDEPGHYIGAIPYVEPFTLGDTPSWVRQMYYLVAGLFAYVERPLEPSGSARKPLEQNLGESMARLYVLKERSPSIERRFIRLLDADHEQLPSRLRQTVTLLKSNDIPIGWEQLLDDLGYWRSEQRRVQHRWARSFYQRAERETQPQESTPEPQLTGGNE
ncbi:type I-E CRISPR-associated protein Cse2/CasB [Meiothermus sp. CFH 77666]|uniref:type I-E CRISPR-associated protein Cse2/CasB n=1 Tax=Meiothermus sp. CFH 77666 TaxID=2817942 RepID=UPI001AA08987|nr:type I-E CRISPR-associated protein Cse2/CasB [Meiothermus sp. CFH 77666]MBO1437421.1 type I-E CRISPR-associated protein Cse2/CasB [Meiothermus sp. CFH 77666]